MSLFGVTGGTGPINANGLTIMKASYGLQNTFTDVTKEVQQLFQNDELNFIVSSQSLGILDPAPGVIKTLQIQHAVNGGHPQLMTKNDGDQVLISVPKVITPGEKSQTPTFFGSIWYGISAAVIMIIAMSFYGVTIKYWGPDPNKSAGMVGSLLFVIAIATYGHLIWVAVPFLIFIGMLYGMPQVAIPQLS